MALFHLKQNRHRNNQIKDNNVYGSHESENFCANNWKSNSIEDRPSGILKSVKTGSKIVMLPGVNLGHVMKQTVLEELWKIRMENMEIREQGIGS